MKAMWPELYMMYVQTLAELVSYCNSGIYFKCSVLTVLEGKIITIGYDNKKVHLT